MQAVSAIAGAVVTGLPRSFRLPVDLLDVMKTCGCTMPSKISPVWWFLVLFVVTSALLVGLAGLSIICTTHNWDGGFEQAEYRLTFSDRAGRPLEGVELLVTDSAGNPFPAYPISDWQPGNPMRSDVNGQLVCRHVRYGLEFGGRAYRLLWLIPVGETAPVFKCRFLLQGEEVASCDYRDLALGANRAGEVLRSWNLEHYVSEVEKAWGSQQDVLAGKDRNRDGVVSTAERAAWNALVDVYGEYRDRKQRGLPLTEDRHFRVIKKTIMLNGEALGPGKMPVKAGKGGKGE